MAESAAAAPSGRRLNIGPRRAAPGGSGRWAWLPAWSVPAAARALRATIVVPGLFALTLEGIGNPQIALFTVFGCFATLVMASFGGSRRDKAVAHLGLALVGSAALVTGTAVSGTTWLAALVTIPVAFAIFFAGVAGPNAASGVTAALLAYVLPVGSAGTMSTAGSRLAGWWLASAVSTAAVLLLSPRSPGDRLRAAASASAAALAADVDAAARGGAAPGYLKASVSAKHDLMNAFAAAPYRPTGLATADQALASLVQLLEWCTELTGDAMDGHLDASRASAADRELLSAAAAVLRDAAGLLDRQRDGQAARPDIGRLERARAASAAHQHEPCGDPASVRECAAHAVHAQVIAVTARAVVADALIAAGQAGPQMIAAQRREWYGEPEGAPPARRRLAGLTGALGIVARHASIRSMWFRSSARGAVALAAAVAVADLSGVQHGFWVVLGTLSVLRTSAASTGSTALRALVGTVAGFAVGAALLLAIGTAPAALWTALPVAVLVASYAPGTAPFAVGQAAFTITVVVLFNLLVPAGWTVGLLRIQDVAIGGAVSLAVGILFWPRGAATVVGDDLADAFRRGGAYLTQAVDWALGLRPEQPDTAVAAVTAGIRLNDALRGYLAEQGAKRLSKDDLWHLVMAATRLRLTANSVAGLGAPAATAAHAGGRAVPERAAPVRAGVVHANAVRAALSRLAADLVGFYDRLAAQLGPPARRQPVPALVPAPDVAQFDAAADRAAAMASDGPDAGHRHPHSLWVRDHLRHLAEHAPVIITPAARLARLRTIPWWR